MIINTFCFNLIWEDMANKDLKRSSMTLRNMLCDQPFMLLRSRALQPIWTWQRLSHLPSIQQCWQTHIIYSNAIATVQKLEFYTVFPAKLMGDGMTHKNTTFYTINMINKACKFKFKYLWNKYEVSIYLLILTIQMTITDVSTRPEPHVSAHNGDDVPRWQSSWGQHGAHLGPVGPRWAPCWPHGLAIRVLMVSNEFK